MSEKHVKNAPKMSQGFIDKIGKKTECLNPLNTWRKKWAQLWIVQDAETGEILCDNHGRPCTFKNKPMGRRKWAKSATERRWESIPVMMVALPGWRSAREKASLKQYMKEEYGIVDARFLEEINEHLHPAVQGDLDIAGINKTASLVEENRQSKIDSARGGQDVGYSMQGEERQRVYGMPYSEAENLLPEIPDDDFSF